MKLMNIKESGCSNTLMWAIANGAEIYGDDALCSIINDEMYYLVSFSDVNFFELFRLTQSYRDRLKILEEKVAEVPSRNSLATMFPGSIPAEDEKNPDKVIPKLEIAEHAIQMFMNLALQMNTDNDIITPGASRMFLPMISRRFNIQIPIPFMEIVRTCKDAEEAGKLFSEAYPGNLNEMIVESETSNVRMMLELNFVKFTSILKYNERYEKFMNLVKYAPLKKSISSRLYRYNFIGFSKYDNVNRSEIKCSLFYPNKDIMNKKMKHMRQLKTPLKVEFVIQLPIQYMQMIENTFDPEEIDIMYESSMSNIIDAGLSYDDFVSPEWDVESEDEELKQKTIEYNNAISAYAARINEANKTTLAAIPLILNNQNVADVDITSTFAMFPSIYTTKAVIVLNSEYADKYRNVYDPMLQDMFNEMIEMMNSITEDINSTK